MLHKLNGKYPISCEMFNEVYQQYRIIYGDHHQSTINTLVNLATTRKDMHEFKVAADLYEIAIEGRKATEGE